MTHTVGKVHLFQSQLSLFQTGFGRRAVVDERQFHVVQRTGARQQIKGLEYEADFLVADTGQFIVCHVADQTPVNVILTLRRRVEAADQIHQGRLAGAGRAHDSHILAAVDFDTDARNRIDGLVAHDVGLPEIVGVDDNTFALEAFALFDGVGYRCAHIGVLNYLF